MPDPVIYPAVITVKAATEAIAHRVRAAGSDFPYLHAAEALAALADLTGTTPEGVAVALTAWRSGLCGAADVLPHVEAERDRYAGAFAAVRALHRPCHDDNDPAACVYGQTWTFAPIGCVECRDRWPCRTIAALDRLEVAAPQARVEYMVQLRQNDGTWGGVVTWSGVTASAADALADLADARWTYPSAAYRVASRTIPGWTPVADPTLRDRAAQEATDPPPPGGDTTEERTTKP